tara:strand:- start:347 stop:769 length:423 start_codon:yes stop_codon:yes gene_type:complete
VTNDIFVEIFFVFVSKMHTIMPPIREGKFFKNSSFDALRRQRRFKRPDDDDDDIVVVFSKVRGGVASKSGGVESAAFRVESRQGGGQFGCKVSPAADTKDDADARVAHSVRAPSRRRRPRVVLLGRFRKRVIIGIVVVDD